MNSFEFNCSTADCGVLIPALVSQGGMRVLCPDCGTPNRVPTFQQPAVAVADTPPAAQQNTIAQRLRRTGEEYARQETGPLSDHIFGKKKTAAAPPPEAEAEAKPSLIDRLYSATGAFIDRQLGADPAAEGTFREKLQRARAAYLELSPYRRRHIAFFISAFLIFLIVSAIGASLWSGLAFMLIYASFVALNQISFLNRIFSTITDVVVALTVFFLPEAIKDLMASLLKYLVFVLVVISFGKYVGPAYMAYKAFLVISDKQEA